MANRSGSSTTAKKAIQKKICSTCGDEKSMREFYNSYNSLHKDNKSPICKTCMKNACYDENGEFDIENFQSILRQLDRPFIQDLWDSSIAVNCLICLPYCHLTYKNFGSPDWTRTSAILINSQAFYQLDYRGI